MLKMLLSCVAEDHHVIKMSCTVVVSTLEGATEPFGQAGTHGGTTVTLTLVMLGLLAFLALSALSEQVHWSLYIPTL